MKIANLIVSLENDEEYPILNLRKMKLTDETVCINYIMPCGFNVDGDNTN